VTPEPAAPAEPDEPDSAALRLAAVHAGSEISDRMLETFRSQELIPRPRRVGYRGHAPEWRYPSGTERQLIALLRWRRHTKDAGLLKILLWLDGHEIPASGVRDAIAGQLRSMAEAMEHEITLQMRRLGLDSANDSDRLRAIEALATSMAAKRGTSPIPRYGRMRADERAHAVALMIRLFGLGETIEGTAAEAQAIERVLGMTPNGRHRTIGDTGPWLTGPAEDMFTSVDVAGLPRLIEVISDASDNELATARQHSVALFRYLPLMARMIEALSDDPNYTGLASLSQLEQHPELSIYIVPLVISMLRAGWNESLGAISSALQPMPQLAEQAQRILDMPTATIHANLANQPPEVREGAQRIINAAIAGKFDIDTTS
jgi:hypothetical protein